MLADIGVPLRQVAYADWVDDWQKAVTGTAGTHREKLGLARCHAGPTREKIGRAVMAACKETHALRTSKRVSIGSQIVVQTSGTSRTDTRKNPATDVMVAAMEVAVAYFRGGLRSYPT
ncbi:hypothetical protein L484_016208 [Morus notabilis]|uniref:Uncharacterized protein n=1 Tax=Morus notabilis TaxID=981085 RepID=W9RWV7_9ROSA|nr:hypothetical protein L484_016208 [Morus notabilis]